MQKIMKTIDTMNNESSIIDRSTYMIKMPIKEFLQAVYATHDYSQFIDNMYWEGGYQDGLMIEYIMNRALAANIQLTDLNYDYERDLYITYTETEKGLS